jgi:nitrous oxidase accessory protein NosD
MPNSLNRRNGRPLVRAAGLAALVVAAASPSAGPLRAAAARAGEHVVSTPAQLSAAVKSSHAGDVISLAPGDYGDVTLRNTDVGGALTIASRDAGAMAKLTSLTIEGGKAIKVRSLEIALPAGGTAVKVSGSDNISLDGLNVHGSATPEAIGSGNGMLIRGSSNVSVLNSDFHNLGNALAHLDSDHLTISRNQFHDIRVDGVRGGGSSNVAITSNVFRNFVRLKKEHPDAIQFWTTRTKESAHDIRVADNMILRDAGSPMQGIFITDQTKGRLPYRNVEVTGNVVIGAMFHGITLMKGENITVARNTVAGYQDMNSWIMLEGVSGGVVQDNEASSFRLQRGNTGIDERNNRRLSLAPVGDKKALKHWYSGRKDDLAKLPESAAQLAQ